MSMHSGGTEFTKLTHYTGLVDNLIRHRGDRLIDTLGKSVVLCTFRGISEEVWVNY